MMDSFDGKRYELQEAGEAFREFIRPAPAEKQDAHSRELDESDPIELQLVATLDVLLAKDVELSAAYREILTDRRKKWPEVRRMRAELRRLHTEEGALLLEIKLHRARKGRGGGWAEFLRQRQPKPLSRTTADRWIKWYLDSQKDEQSSQPPPPQSSENAPQNKGGAFSGDALPMPAPGDTEPSVAADPPVADGSNVFEDPQQVILLLKRGEATRFKAAAEFLADKIGSVTHHQAIYVTVVEAAAKLGFVYPAALTD